MLYYDWPIQTMRAKNLEPCEDTHLYQHMETVHNQWKFDFEFKLNHFENGNFPLLMVSTNDTEYGTFLNDDFAILVEPIVWTQFDDANRAFNNFVIYTHWNDFFYTGDIFQYAFEGEIYRTDAWVTVNMTQHFLPEDNLYELRTTVTQMNSFGAMVNKTEVFLIDPTKQYPWPGKPNGILPFPVRPFYDVKVHGGTGWPGWVLENNATVRHALFTTYHDEHPVSTVPPTTTTTAPPCGEECLIPEGTFCPGNFATGNNKIVGGEEAVPHSWPWIVTLNNPYQYCAGSILNEEWIITASHCTEGQGSKSLARIV